MADSDERMTGRERVLCALRHEEGDRVPLDFAAWRSSGIHAGTYARLRKHLGLPEVRPRLYDLMQQLAEPDDDIKALLHADVEQVHQLCPSFGIAIDRWKDGVLADGTPVMVPEQFHPVRRADGAWEICEGDTPIARMTSGGLYFDRVHFPLKDAQSEADLDRLCDWDATISRTELDFMRGMAERARATVRAVLLCFGGNIFEGGQFLMGYQDYMCAVAGDPPLVQALGERLAHRYVRNLELLLPEVEGLVDIIACGDDLGLQRGLQISRDDYRALIMPYHARVYDCIRRGSSAWVFLHCCGAIADLLPDLIEAGVQIINPVQISAAGMEPVRLKRTFGKELTFWGGGCDTQRVLPHGTVEDVRAEVRRNMAVFKPGGGFVFTQVHNILDGVPPANIEALYREAYAQAWYR